MTFIASDRSGHYQTLEPVTREQIIRFAHSLLTRQFRNRRKITSSEDVRQWLVMKLALENRESFGVIMLSQQHHILGYWMLICWSGYATSGGSVVTVVGRGVRWPAMKSGQC